MAKHLYRSSKNCVIAGVCGGIGEYYDTDPVIIRLLWVLGTVISVGAGIIVYIVAWILMPRK